MAQATGGLRLRVLITGGCGFIGSHAVREILRGADIQTLVNLDALTYSGNPGNLTDITDERYKFIHGSINDYKLVSSLIADESVDVILHLAAETHVDRSINSVAPFVEANIEGTRVLLECVRDFQETGKKINFIHVSTDEVYGSLDSDEAPFTEETPLNPMNPYSSTKAASDMLVRAFVNTYDVSAAITRCSNNYGSHQFPEKLIPLMTLNAIEGKSLPVYGDGLQIRDWIHVTDHVRGILATMDALVDGTLPSGEVVNFGANNEITNIEIVRNIVEITGASEELITYVDDRLGHDRRYAMGFEKASKILNWEPLIPWGKGLAETVNWYLENVDWVSSIRTGSYRKWSEISHG